MPTGIISQNAAVGGLSIQSTVSRTASSQIGHETELPAASAGTLSTRTDDNTGIVTLAEGHGLEIGDVVDVYWGDAGGSTYRYGMDVTDVDGNDVTIDGGAGTNLPAQDTAVTVAEQVTLDTDFDGDLLEMIVASASRRSHVGFRDSVPTVLKEVELPAGEAWAWAADQGIANPLAGNPVNDLKASCGDSAGAATLKIGLLYEAES